ncbi:hypothetical protein [Kocuria nitroreducens]|uniref:hypothetical protein n=1 Tax=Kocuria nitroreducens TaxID=3058914 RepID=UPI0036DB7CCF
MPDDRSAAADPAPGHEPAPGEPGHDPVPELLVGLVLSPQIASVLPQDLAASLPGPLHERCPGVRWRVAAVTDRLVVPPAAGLDLLESARDRMLDEDWDLVVVLTDVPLKDGRSPVLTQLSPVHGVGLVAVPALGALHVGQKVRQTTVRVVGHLLGHDTEDAGDADAQEELVRRARQRSEDLEDRPEDNAVQFTARVLGGNVRLLLGMVRANRPWTLVVRLSRLLALAAATGVLTLVAADLWLLAAAYGPWRLGLLSLLSVGAVTGALIVGARLWERPRRRAEREQVALFNLATAATVAIGVVVFHAAVFALSWLGALVLVDGGVFADAIGAPVGAVEYVKLGWLTATLATVGGALGAGLEDDDAVRAAAYTRSEP